jgi:hypothetical protein
VWFARVNPETVPNNATSYPGTLRFVDTTVEPGEEYSYKIEVVHPDGSTELWHEVATARAASPVPIRYALRLAGPHPIRLSRGAEVSIDVPAPGANVRVVLYDIAGREAARLADGYLGPGTHSRSIGLSRTRRLGSGVYFLRMEAGSFVTQRRVVLLP